ncbi:MAG: YhjD/YihY/BrkB family envelope integrity protein [Pirellulales bacterium]
MPNFSALNEVWNVKPDPKKNSVRYFLTKRILSLGMVLTLGLLTLVSVVASSAIASTGNAIGHWIPRYMEVAMLSSFNLALSFCLLTGLFTTMYRVLPDAEIAWRDVFVGAAVTATLFILGESIITLYLFRQNIASLYGAAGSLIVLLTWVYYSTLTLLFGAELTYAWASTRGARTVPSPGAMIADKESEPSRDSPNPN